MSADVKVPPFPESVEEGTLTAWHKQEGDAVERDEKIADIETDKIVLEVSASEAGVLSGLDVKEGDTVQAGQLLARIESGGEGSKPSSASKDSDKKDAGTKKDTEAGADEEQETVRAERPATDTADDAASPEEDADKDSSARTGKESAARRETEPVRLSPAVRRLIDEHDLDPADIPGSGRGGMITKADVLQYLESPTDGAVEEETEEKQPETTTKSEAAPPAPRISGVAEGRPEKRVPLSRIRARIAERLVEAQQTAAILTTFNEVNMQPIIELRKRYKDEFEKVGGVKLGFMSFFVKASVDALKRFPVINATLDGGDIVYHGYFDIGVAVSTERGLVVPILRDADRQSYSDIERNIADFANRAQAGKLGLEELTGGTFSITNGGIFGSMLSTPILNPPQSAILGMHKIEERPMAENGQVVVRPVMYLALSYDHRLIDGREAVQFLVAIKENLEDPARMLLDL